MNCHLNTAPQQIHTDLINHVEHCQGCQQKFQSISQQAQSVLNKMIEIRKQSNVMHASLNVPNAPEEPRNLGAKIEQTASLIFQVSQEGSLLSTQEFTICNTILNHILPIRD